MPTHAWAQIDQTIDIRPDADQVTGEALRKAFTDITHAGAYNFARNGKAKSKYTETTTKDGVTTYIEDGKTFIGQWVTDGELLCFRYDADSMPGGCFRVYKIANCYYYYGAGMSTNTNGGPNPNRDTYWTARSVRKGEPAQCDMVV